MNVEKNTGKFYGIGVGPGDPELLTLKAVRVLKSSDFIFEASSGEGNDSIAGSVCKAYLSGKKDLIPLHFPMVKDKKAKENAWLKNATLIADKLSLGFTCAFVTIGDPMLYSTCSYLFKELKKIIPKLPVELIPGISSFQALASKTHTPIAEDKESISIFPAFSEEIVEKIKSDQADTIIIMKPFRTRKDVLKLIKRFDCSVIYGSKLCLRDEKIESSIKKIEKLPEEYLSLFIIKKRKSDA
jgi:precorrin-2/cobalt-factor-2 C20-methyltransferase